MLFQKIAVMFLVNILERNICQDSLAGQDSLRRSLDSRTVWLLGLSAGAFHEGDAYPFKLAFQVIQEFWLLFKNVISFGEREAIVDFM